MARDTRITVDGLEAWERGLDRIHLAGSAKREEWLAATEVFFSRTQQAVHILSGDLLASGRYSVSRGVSTVTGEVAYGGTDACDYAVYEFARGGNHDALTRGFVAAQRDFTRALVRGVEREVDSWK